MAETIELRSPVRDSKIAEAAALELFNLTWSELRRLIPNIDLAYRTETDVQIALHWNASVGAFQSATFTSKNADLQAGLEKAYRNMSGDAELRRRGIAAHLPIIFITEKVTAA